MSFYIIEYTVVSSSENTNKKLERASELLHPHALCLVLLGLLGSGPGGQVGRAQPGLLLSCALAALHTADE